MDASDPVVSLLVEVPFCAFRPFASREYQDTYPVPTPASVYGMLMSLVGVPREEKARHRGCELAIAVEALPQRSRVFRKLRRGEELRNLRPDYQDLLADVRLRVWLRKGNDTASPPLAERVRKALQEPETLRRSGGLSLGESSYLVNSVTIEEAPPAPLFFIRPAGDGFYALPAWVDHAESSATTLVRCSVSEATVESAVADCWIRI
jgi:CRISPR-associated protein Cas5t